jgi:hypothetical protein
MKFIAKPIWPVPTAERERSRAQPDDQPERVSTIARPGRESGTAPSLTHRYDLGDIGIVRKLPAMIDDCPPGHLAPMHLAERTVVGAYLADRGGYAVGDAALASTEPRIGARR